MRPAVIPRAALRPRIAVVQRLGQARLLAASLRTRLIAGYVALLAVAVVLSFAVAREILLTQLDERIDRELVQETQELRRLAGGNDPETGEPFGTGVRRILEVYFDRNIPSRNEAFVAFVDGEPVEFSSPAVDQRLDEDPELAARWSALSEPDRGRAETPAGPIEYLAVPLEAGSETRGVFVVAMFAEREGAGYDDAIIAVGGVGLAALLVGSLLFWRLSEGVLRPVRLVTGTARAISETDLGGRIPVEGEDEVAQLAATFNAMLDRLERAFDAQREFLDDAGHELRTPITIVRGHLEVLGDDPEERAATIALVLDEVERMSRIVDDLLLLAKAEQPDFLRLTTVDVEELTEQLYAKSTAIAPRAWRLERSGRGRIVADRQRLTQALVQLAQNAAKHTREGDAIAIGSAIDGHAARFWVRDSGPGLPPEEHGAAFGRFWQGRAPGGDGMGLGLAIVKAIVEAHRGGIEVDSRPGAGATFTIVVPVDRPDGEEERL